MTAVPSSSEDTPLIAAALSGQDEAFRELVVRYKRLVLGIVGRFGSTPEDVDDLAQEVFLQAFRSLSQFRQEAPFPHWLSRIAIRKSYEYLRRNKARKFNIPLEEAPEASDLRELDPDRKARVEWVQTALARLNPKEQLVLKLMELQGYSVREIAQATGWTESNVKVRAHRARASLKEMLERIDR